MQVKLTLFEKNIFKPPNGVTLGHSSIRTYSIQCSGKRGIEAIVHMGKLICKERCVLENWPRAVSLGH